MKHIKPTKAGLPFYQAEVGERVRFPTRTPGLDLTDYIEVKLDKDGTLEISTPDGTIIVRPRVSNVIAVELDKF